MKKLLFTIIFILLIICSCLCPEVALSASKQGIQTWAQQILPALLPFSILSGILLKSKILESFGTGANLSAVLLTLVCGFVFGFPIGAKLAADFYSRSLLTRKQATILSICANNFSIMYVFGYVLPTLFSDRDYKACTYVFLYLIPLSLGVILLLLLKQEKAVMLQKKSASRFQMDMQIIDAGIISGFESLIKICGYIVVFSLISQMIQHALPCQNLFCVILLGNLEVTNGIQLLNNSTCDYKYLIMTQLLSFGGLSGLAQTASILKPSGLSIKSYVCGKMLLSALSVLVLLICFNIYNG